MLLLTQLLQIVRELVYKLSPYCLLLNGFVAFLLPLEPFLKHSCSISTFIWCCCFSPVLFLCSISLVSCQSHYPKPQILYFCVLFFSTYFTFLLSVFPWIKSILFPFHSSFSSPSPFLYFFFLHQNESLKFQFTFLRLFITL